MLIIHLTDEQRVELAGAYAKLGELAATGKPGMLVAQIYGDHMRVGIMSNETAHKFYNALGTPPERRRAHRSAYDLLPDASNDAAGGTGGA